MFASQQLVHTIVSHTRNSYPELRMTSHPRWQLNRAGITNVYQYEHETLNFRDGRLLLRGINGSGKSTAMNMLLPFLLTGKTRGIDAAGEQTGVLKSWMLSGRDERQPVGYLWVEFEHRESADAASEHLVLGCGIRANRTSDTVVTWWFITPQRPGIDFELLEAQVPLSVDSLRSVLAPDPVFAQDRRADYRREVVRRLFGGASIDSFLDLINTVRSPRVGDRVDVELPQYLVSAMPNLSENALIEAARPLDDLDEHRRNVFDLGTTETALAAMAEVYRQYALSQISAELQDARECSTAYRRARDRAKAAEEASIEAQRNEQQAREHQALLEAHSDEYQNEIQALQSSSAYTDGQQLEDLRRHVQSARKRADDDKEKLADQQNRQPALVSAVERGEQLSDERLQLLTDELSIINREVQQTGITTPMLSVSPLTRRTLPNVGINEPVDEFDADAVRSELKKLVALMATRTADIDTVRKQMQQVEAAQSSLRDAQAAHALATETVADNQERFEQGRADLELSRQAWKDELERWLSDAQQAVESIDDKATPSSASSTLHELSSPDLHQHHQQLEHAINNAVYIQHEIQLRTHSVLDERSKGVIEAQQVFDDLNKRTEPEVPTLDWQKRSAPCLADVVDFRDAVDETQRAGIEAALQASTLLTATLEPSGARLGNGDLLITGSTPVAYPLSEWLEVTLPDGYDSPEFARQVEEVLNSIATRMDSDCASVISTSGSFRLGALSGQHEKATAEFVGVSARRARLERLRKEAEEQLAVVQQAQLEAQQRYDTESVLLLLLKRQKDTLPSLSAVDAAINAAGFFEEQLERSRDRLAQRHAQVMDAESRLGAADDEYQRICRNLDLPAAVAELGAIERTLRDVQNQIHSTMRLVDFLLEASRDWRLAIENWRLAQVDLDKALQSVNSSQLEFNDLNARLDTLEATLGESYRDVVARISVSEQKLSEARRELPLARDKTEACIRASSDAGNEMANSASHLKQRENDCVQAHQRLTRVVSVPGLMAVVMHTDTEDPATASQSDLDMQLPQTTADAQGLDKLVKHLRSQLPEHTGSDISADNVRTSLRRRRDSLGAGWDAEDQQPDIELPLSISVTGPLGQMPLANSLLTVRQQLSQLQALLSEKQDQALRNLLQGLIAREVAERMFEAKRLIERMNARLHSVTSSHGIGVRLRWRRSPELNDATARTVEILGKTPDLRTEEESTILRESLADALDEARRLAPDAPYRELIAQVLDYRAWHQMSILLRREGDTEKRLTRRTPLSEGEKKLVSYLPLFAAVAAACDALADAGGEAVPRFLLLDDAFAKVSEDNHAALFGLLVSLDLDFIATSERLWGTHATVPGLAITEVVRDTALNAILLENSVWDGKTLTLSAPLDAEADTWGELGMPA